MKSIVISLLVLGLACSSGSATAATIQYTYDMAGHLIKADYGDDKNITYGYDASGNLLVYAARGGIKRGDVNMDNAVNIADVVIALHLLSGRIPDGMDIAGYLESQHDAIAVLTLSEIIYMLQDVAELRQKSD